MKVVQEFREFAVKGNVADLAVGVIIGAAFGKIVASLVADIIMPPISYLLGNVDFTNLYLLLKPGKPGVNVTTLADAKTAGAITWNYGVFLNAVIEFFIVAVAVFFLVKQMNRLRRKGPAPSATTKACPECTSQIPLAARRCPSCTAVLAT